MEELSKYLPTIIQFGKNICLALVIFIIGRFIIKTVLKISKKFFENSRIDNSVSKFLIQLIRFGLYGILLIIILDKVGVQTTSFVAVLGTASLAFGLSLQGSLANLAGGVLILIVKPFTSGDYIIVDDCKQEGFVEHIDIFYTHIVTPDNKAIVIPNGTLTNVSLTNCSAFEFRRLELEFGVSYDTDIKKAKNVIENVLKNDNDIKQDKEIFVYVKELEASQVTLGMWAYVSSKDYLKIKYKVTEEIKTALDENSIEIPYNHLVIESINKKR